MKLRGRKLSLDEGYLAVLSETDQQMQIFQADNRDLFMLSNAIYYTQQLLNLLYSRIQAIQRPQTQPYASFTAKLFATYQKQMRYVNSLVKDQKERLSQNLSHQKLAKNHESILQELKQIQQQNSKPDQEAQEQAQQEYRAFHQQQLGFYCESNPASESEAHQLVQTEASTLDQDPFIVYTDNPVDLPNQEPIRLYQDYQKDLASVVRRIQTTHNYKLIQHDQF